MKTRGPLAAWLVLLFGAGLALLNFPLLKLWLVDATVAGLPLTPLALFAVWFVLVAVLALLMERRSGD
jgi:hypothetical protein